MLGLTEAQLRLAAFAIVFALMALAETRWPRRDRSYPRGRRWPTNLGMLALGALLVRLMATVGLPWVAVAAAIWSEQYHSGLLRLINVPYWAGFALSLLLLDLLIWAQHAAFHRLPWLWRIHRVHHADRDIDTSTALRFHPFEIGLSMLIKSAAVLLLGAPAVAVIVFEIVLNAMALFNHANVRLPVALDRVLRLLLVTPDMHRIHHSVDAREHQRNFGFNLSVWDRLFGSYLHAPRAGQLGMRIGLAEYQTQHPNQLGWSLQLPLSPGSTP